MKVSAERLDALIAAQFTDAAKSRKDRSKSGLAQFVAATVRAKNARRVNDVQRRLAGAAQLAAQATDFATTHTEISNEGSRRDAIAELNSIAEDPSRASSERARAATAAQALERELKRDVETPRSLASALASFVASNMHGSGAQAAQAKAEGRIADIHAAVLRQVTRRA